MLTTAGAARATASAKPGSGTVRIAVRAAAFGAALCDGAVTAPRRDGAAPSSTGFHQTKRNAAARPTITAFARKLRMVRAWRNYYRSSYLGSSCLQGTATQSVYNAPALLYGKHYSHRGLREDLSTLDRTIE